jgi:hypothetical protein
MVAKNFSFIFKRSLLAVNAVPFKEVISVWPHIGQYGIFFKNEDNLDLLAGSISSTSKRLLEKLLVAQLVKLYLLWILDACYQFHKPFSMLDNILCT